MFTERRVGEILEAHGFDSAQHPVLVKELVEFVHAREASQRLVRTAVKAAALSASAGAQNLVEVLNALGQDE